MVKGFTYKYNVRTQPRRNYGLNPRNIAALVGALGVAGGSYAYQRYMGGDKTKKQTDRIVAPKYPNGKPMPFPFIPKDAKKRPNLSFSRSSGFLKTRKQKRKNKLKGNQSRQGIHGTFETGGILSAAQICYVGHATAPRDIVFRLAWQSILKQLLIMMNIKLNNIEELAVANGNVVSGDKFRFSFYVNPTVTTLTSVDSTVSITTTWKNIAQVFGDMIYSTTQYQQIIPVSFSYLPASLSTGLPPAILNLEYGMLSFYFKSALKIQNRTINSTDNDESDNVDNCPLYGKTIGGNGTGCSMLFPNGAAFPAQVVCSTATGVIQKVTVDPDLEEPLSGFYFPKSTQEGKVKLEPGQLKTSVLTYSRRISLAYLYKLFFLAGTGTPPPSPIVPFGKYRFFQLERMIDTRGSPPEMKIALEHNLEGNCVFMKKNNWVTTPVIENITL